LSDHCSFLLVLVAWWCSVFPVLIGRGLIRRMASITAGGGVPSTSSFDDDESAAGFDYCWWWSLFDFFFSV